MMPRTAPHRRRLAGEARAYAAAGWPVAAGAWWDPRDARYRCAQPNCVTEGLHPTLPGASFGVRRCQVSVVQASTRDLSAVVGLWRRWPYSVLLPTGQVSDVVELRASSARRMQALRAAYGQLGPVATFPDGRVLLFTAVAGAPDADLAAELASVGALHHSQGSWVPLPPSQLASGPLDWTHSPGAAQWRLPSLHEVTDVLRLALSSASPAEGR